MQSMNNRISFEDYLNKYESLTYSNKGVSMFPLLHEGKDLFTVIKKKNCRCAVGNVVLYRRLSGDYVLHRIIKVRNDDYVILGDNCIQKEYGICDHDIIGVMTAFVRNGKEHSITEFRYRLYTFLIVHTVSIRIFFKLLFVNVKSFIKRGIKWLMKKTR